MKKFILFAIIILLLVPTITMAGKKYDEKEILEDMLRQLEGEFLEFDINMGGVLADKFLSRGEMEDFGDKIRDLLDIAGEEADPNRDITNETGSFYVREFVYDEGFAQMCIYGYTKDLIPITIILGSYRNEGTLGETTLFINLIKDEQKLNINGIIEKIESIFKSYGKPLERTTCIMGTIEGRLDKDIDRIIKRFKAKIVEEYNDPYLTSYTIYSPIIKNQIFSGDKKVNINLGIRYNNDENKTYIWIGTPIITTGY